MTIFESWLIKAPIAKHGLWNDKFPEHSMGAIDNAIENNFSIMLSVQTTSDGTIICYSDKALARLTDNSGYVSTTTYEDMKALRLNKTEYSIITLDEALSHIAGRTPVLINIINDCCSNKLQPEIYKIMSKTKGEYAVMSTNPSTVEWFKLNAPAVVRGIKSCKFSEKMLCSYKTRKLQKLKYCKLCDPDFICYQSKQLPNRFVRHHKELPLIAWGVTSNKDYQNMLKYSDNIVFDSFIPEI